MKKTKGKLKKWLAAAVLAGMTAGLMPTMAWAAAAQVIVEPTYVYWQVYNFDANNQAIARDDEDTYLVTASDAGLTAQKLEETTLTAAVDENTGKWGYQNSDGEWVVPAEYDDYWMYELAAETTVFPMEKDGKAGLIDRTGKTVLDFQFDTLYIMPKAQEGAEVCYAVKKEADGKMGVVDAAGKVLVPYAYADILAVDFYADGSNLVEANREDGTEVIVNLSTGEECFSLPTGSYFYYFDGGKLAQFYSDETGKLGFVDINGNIVVPAEYDDATWFQGDVAMVGKYVGDDQTTMKWALVDATGKLLTDFVYERNYYGEDGDGLFIVNDPETGLMGAIDTAGNVVTPMEYSYLYGFQNGFAVAENEDGDRGLIDTAGNVVLPLAYDYIGDYADYDGVSPYVWIGNYGEDYELHYGIAKVDRNAASQPPALELPAQTAYARTQNILVDGVPVEFQAYALKDAAGNETNYIKLRDVASVLNGTAVQFEVGWDGAVNVITGQGYTANGSEMSTPFSGDRSYEAATAPTNVNGAAADLSAIVLKDDAGNGYTYYKLRDLGAALGFLVDWSAEQGVYLETE